MQAIGGSLDDSCNRVAADPTNQVFLAVTYGSSGVKLDTHGVGDPQAGKTAGGVEKLSGAGGFLWGFEVAGDGANVQTVGIAPNGTVVYWGSFVGSVDLGGGT